MPIEEALTEECPGCGAAVIPARSEAGVVLCALEPVSRPDTARVAAVEVLSGGAVRQVAVVLLPVHRCALAALVADVAGYAPVVLAVGCPLERCGAVPGLACRSPRGALLSRPHGIRAALAQRS